jgi:SHAQKYF class myb-like DNA-binding protein
MGSNTHDEPQIARGLDGVLNSIGLKRNDEPRPDGGVEGKVGTDTAAEPMKKRRLDCGDADMGESQSKISKYEGCTGYLEEEDDDYPPPAEADNSHLEEEDEINIREKSGRTAKALQETITASSSASDESETNWKIDEHQAFVAAVFEIGLMSCSPSVIMENMISLPPHITRERTKSHLQKFRKAKDENKEHFLKEYDEFFKTAEEIKTATSSKGAVAPREDAILSSVLGGRNSNELVGGDAAAILSYSIINNCQHTPDPTKLPFRGASASFPTLTETEKDSELGASLLYVKGLLSHMTEHLLTTRLCQHHRKKNHLSSSSLSKMAAKESTIRSVPNNSGRPYDTGSPGAGRQDSYLCSDEESDEDTEDQRSHLVVSAGPQNQKVIASGVGPQSSGVNHRPVAQQPFNSTMQHGYCCYDSVGQVDPTLNRQTYVVPNAYWSHPPGLVSHPNLNNQQHDAPYFQQHIISSYRNYPQMYPTNNNWHLSSLYTHAERGWYQEPPPSGAHPYHHQPYAHHDRSSTRLPPPQRPPPLQHSPYPPPRYNNDAPPLQNPYPYQGIDSLIEDGDHADGVRSQEKEEVHQRSRPRRNLALSFNFGGNLHPESPEDISPIGKHHDQDHMWHLIPGKNANDDQAVSPETPHRQYPRNNKECGAPFDSNVAWTKRAWVKAQHPARRHQAKTRKNEAHPLW